MAIVQMSSSSNIRQMESRVTFYSWCMLGIISIPLFYMLFLLPFFGSNVLICSAIIAIWICSFIYRKRAALNAGVKGTQMSLSDLAKNLPDEFHIFAGAKVHEKMECALVVTGPTGVFDIEVKNIKGRIEGRETNKTWILHKTGRNGGTYKKELKNPLFNVGRNVDTLSDYLKLEGCPTSVEGFVYFPNDETYWRAIPQGCIVEMEQLLKQITLIRPQGLLAPQHLNAINASLEKCLRDENGAMSRDDFRRRCSFLPLQNANC